MIYLSQSIEFNQREVGSLLASTILQPISFDTSTEELISILKNNIGFYCSREDFGKLHTLNPYYISALNNSTLKDISLWMDLRSDLFPSIKYLAIIPGPINSIKSWFDEISDRILERYFSLLDGLMES